MTSLTSHSPVTRPAPNHNLRLADRVGIAIAILCAALAIFLAVIEIAGASSDLSSLIPFDQPAVLSTFTA